MVNGVAPFLIYDNDPYIVVSNEGRLFWMIDAFTESSTYPYSRHHEVGANNVNYIRNSVKVVIDAYNGTAHFYVFDQQGSADCRLSRHLSHSVSKTRARCPPTCARTFVIPKR